MRGLRIAFGVGLAADCCRGERAGSAGAAAPAVSGPVAAAQQPAVFPPERSIRAVRAFVSRRATSSFALVDSQGRLHGYQARRRYASGSIVKLMLLVAYLRRLEGRMPPPADQQLLHTMIVLSGNKVASIIQGKVGTAALWEVARDAGMRDYSISGSWGSSLISAADQARFFRRFDSMIPAGTRDYARELMSSIDRRQRWGFPRPALDLGFEAFFKIGWRGTATGRLVNAVGMFERDGERVSLAVLTDGNPSHDYGTDTIRGAAERAFGGFAGGGPSRRKTSPAPPPTAAQASSTSTATRPASASTSPTRARTTSPAGGFRATARSGR